METRFFSPLELSEFFNSGKLESDLEDGDAIGVCSIADVLYLSEEIKKRNLKNYGTDLDRKFESFARHPESPVTRGIVIIADLDQERIMISCLSYSRPAEIGPFPG